MIRKYYSQKRRGAKIQTMVHIIPQKSLSSTKSHQKTGINSDAFRRETVHAFMLHFRHRLKNNHNLLIYKMCYFFCLSVDHLCGVLRQKSSTSDLIYQQSFCVYLSTQLQLLVNYLKKTYRMPSLGLEKNIDHELKYYIMTGQCC